MRREDRQRVKLRQVEQPFPRWGICNPKPAPPRLRLIHPNRLPFEGVLTQVDVISDRAPSGARGHRVILTRRAALEALPGLIGMAVDYKAGWDGHDARQKVGIITTAWIVGRDVRVSGFLFAKDFPEVEGALRGSKNRMGMSYELCEAHVEDMRAEIWTLTEAIFTGAAILLRGKAAYEATSFAVCAASDAAREQRQVAAIAAVDLRAVCDGN